MEMRLGDDISVHLFGESHGQLVGALLSGIPPGIAIDREVLEKDMAKRKPGSALASSRKEEDNCEILSGIYNDFTTGWPILIIIKNSDVKSKDYSFLPDIPRPGHSDLPSKIKSSGHADLRGGGSYSARLTAGLVAASSIMRPMIEELNWNIRSHVIQIGNSEAKSLIELEEFEMTKSMNDTKCLDPEKAEEMASLIRCAKEEGDSIGSCVELVIENLPIGVGEPWFDGLEPALSKGLMAIPGARAIEFGRGVKTTQMKGSEHNDSWILDDGKLTPMGEKADGALGGLSTGAPQIIRIHFKPPSSIKKIQKTLNLKTNKQDHLELEGRHDPVLGPRAVAVVEAVARIIISDLGIKGGWIARR